MAFCGAARKARGLPIVLCLTVTVMLGGCGTARDWLGIDSRGGTVLQVGPPVPSRGAPLPAAVGQVLDSAPSGGRLDYQLPDGRPAGVVLGGVYQSGLQVPCRIGRLGAAGGRSDVPSTFAFCRHGNLLYAMPPVVVSGY